MTEGGKTASDAARGMTPQEVRSLVNDIALHLGDNEELAGLLLALFAAAAFSGTVDAEGAYTNLQSALMPYIGPVADAADAFVAARIKEARR